MHAIQRVLSWRFPIDPSFAGGDGFFLPHRGTQLKLFNGVGEGFKCVAPVRAADTDRQSGVAYLQQLEPLDDGDFMVIPLRSGFFSYPDISL